MATMRKGPLGGFTGKLGGKVGYNFRGENKVRNAPKKYEGLVSFAQMEQRQKFSIGVKFLAPLRDFMNQMHKRTIRGISGYDKLSSANMTTMITGSYPDFSIDYNKVRLTTGSLPGVNNPSISCTDGGVLIIRWNDNSSNGSARYSDRIYVAFYDKESETWLIREQIAERGDGGKRLDMPAFRGKLLQVYIGLSSADGLRVSDSLYLGMIIVS
jgi:Family of unknown function (DUF6266)